jgi:hypothetical protein
MGYKLCQYLEKRHAFPYIVAMNILGLVLSLVFIGVVIGLGLVPVFRRSTMKIPEYCNSLVI